MKNDLKSFIACFIILTIFGGFCFYIGWTQFKVPADGFGIMVSKTGGINEEPIVPGKFSWHWEFLLPTNAKLKIFSAKEQFVKGKVKGILPSGEVYSSAFNDSKLDFSYDFEFLASVSVFPESVSNLMKESKISDEESLKKYIENAFFYMCRNVAAGLIETSENGTVFDIEKMSGKDLLSLANAKKSFPELSVSVFTVVNSIFPDVELYNKTKSIYLENLESIKKLGPIENAHADSSGSGN